LSITLREQLTKLRNRAERNSELLTEEATKNALIMPMLKTLGYDVFDPSIVIPEFTADFGVKKGEKVDYAIRIGGEIQILVECKPVNSDLATAHASQLYRYYSVTKARFGILTNGREWRFYSDLDVPNKMDERPFFIFSILEYNDQDLIEFEKFSASAFSVDGILAAASDLKLKSLISETLRQEFSTPSDEFTRMIGKRIHAGNLTAEIRARFSTLIVSCIADILRDQANQRLKAAIDRPVGDAATLAGSGASSGVASPQTAEAIAVPDSKNTTEEEFEAFRIIRAIVRRDIDSRRIHMRDAASYCAILLDNNNRKPIARLYLEGKKKRVGTFKDRVETRHDIESVDDLYSLADEFVAATKGYA
jgi:hypothetical protein